MNGRRLDLAAACLLLLPLLLSGCSFARLAQNKSQLHDTYGLIGTVEGAGLGEVVRVEVLEETEQGFEKRASVAIGEDSQFLFLLDPENGYRVVARAERAGDPAHLLWASEHIPPGVGLEELKRISLVLDDSPPQAELGGAFTEPSNSATPITAAIGMEVALGAPADLDDPRFSASVGDQGLWRPVDFARDRALGLFFLEEYDSSRVPILYVHGAGGSAADWRYHFDHLDRSRYQAWFFQYPSALRLEPLADGLHDLVTLLHEKLRFVKLIVVAHSMGGLVSRGFLARTGDGGASYDTAFVTFSTPWLGHRAAKQGKRFAPTEVPSWIDMAPGSEYLLELSQTPLPDIPHVLFFSHDRGLLPLGVNNDGVVSLSSQLARWAQAGARRIEGFQAGHEGILESEDAFASFERALAELVAVLDEQ